MRVGKVLVVLSLLVALLLSVLHFSNGFSVEGSLRASLTYVKILFKCPTKYEELWIIVNRPPIDDPSMRGEILLGAMFGDPSISRLEKALLSCGNE